MTKRVRGRTMGVDVAVLAQATSRAVTGRDSVETLLGRGGVETSVLCPHCGAVAGQAVVAGALLVDLQCGNRRCRRRFDRVLPRGRTELDIHGGAEFRVRCTRCDLWFGRVTVKGHARLDLKCPGCRTGLAWPDKPWPKAPEGSLTGTG